MKHLSIIVILACLTFSACTPKFIKQYENSMIQNPETQAEKDNNIILKYLVDNKLDFKSTESGIYYSIDKEGEGGHPKATDVVNTHYKGYRLDGKVFDSSYDRGEPIEFSLNGVIKGWQEAIPMLKKGGKGTFIIPSGIAYGERGAGPDIPANTVLIFDVELLDFFAPEDKAKRQKEKDEQLIKEYLAANNVSAQRTESGIHYVIKEQGDGVNPSVEDNVKVHYRGALLDGTQFDSSYDRGEPATFPLSRVVPGWQESIPLLKKGGKGTFYIPSGLAYGERGAGGVIPPNAVLVFDVELLDVMNQAQLDKMREEEQRRENEKAGQQASLDEEIIRKFIKEKGWDAKRTPEGVYYIVEEAGSDPKPTINSSVTVHYEGTLLDGTKFDSSYDRGQPATFPLKGVVEGWQVGIPQFGKGGKGKLIIPSGLAYGPRSAGEKIPPNSILIFKVEVLEVK